MSRGRNWMGFEDSVLIAVRDNVNIENTIPFTILVDWVKDVYRVSYSTAYKRLMTVIKGSPALSIIEYREYFRDTRFKLYVKYSKGWASHLDRTIPLHKYQIKYKKAE